MRHAALAIAATTAFLFGVLAFAGLAQADDIAWKLAHDTDPHLPLTPKQLQMTAAKRAAETSSAPVFPGPIPTYACGGGCGGGGGGGYPSSASLVANQTAQITSYYCGPAAVHEALDALGVALPQSAAATALRTTTDGTAWSGGGTSPSGYPVPDVMNRYQSRNYYAPQYVGSATSSAISTYENDLMYDISVVRAPVIGDAWETQYSSYHLVGHPRDRTIFHWFEIRGYYGYGDHTLYEDSVHNATSVSWYASVPAYSNFPSSEIVSVVSGRGYVW